jgi:hypothetical protein
MRSESTEDPLVGVAFLAGVLIWCDYDENRHVNQRVDTVSQRKSKQKKLNGFLGFRTETI